MTTNEPFRSARTTDETMIQPPVTSPLALPETKETDDDMDSALTSQHRIISKSGRCNMNLSNVKSRKRKYFADIFTTLIDMRWLYSLMLYTSVFVSTWVVFGLIWWFIAFVNRYNEDLTEPGSAETCVDNVHDFISAFLFSIETQLSIGYGSRVIGSSCPHAIVVFLVQSLVGLCVECVITGLVFLKLSRPKARAQTIVFSQRAVVCVRDGGFCLLFRIGDMRRSHFVQTNIRAVLVKRQVTTAACTKEEEAAPLFQFPLDLETEDTKRRDFVFLAWPVTIIHRITERSPLWETTKDELSRKPMEVIVIVEGIVEVSGKNLQLLTSYTNTEIVWGSQLTPLSTYTTKGGKTEIDFSAFHSTAPVAMPNESARLFAMEKQTTKDNKCNSTFTGSEADDLCTYEPLTFAPIKHIRFHKRRRCKVPNAWKKWRRFLPMNRILFLSHRRK